MASYLINGISIKILASCSMIIEIKKPPRGRNLRRGSYIPQNILVHNVAKPCELLHSTSTTVVSRVVPSLLFRTLTVTVQTPEQSVSTVIASPTFQVWVSSLSVDDQQFSVVVSSHIDGAGCRPSTLALMVMDAQPRSDPLSIVIITAPSIQVRLGH